MSAKRKLCNKTVLQNCEAIRDIEEGMTNREFATEYGVPKNQKHCFNVVEKYRIKISK